MPRSIRAFLPALSAAGALLLLVSLGRCAPDPARSTASVPHEVGRRAGTLKLLPLEGAAASSEAELSGLDWLGDLLVLLPQQPEVTDDCLFTLTSEALLAAVEAPRPTPLTPSCLRIYYGPEVETLPGFDGYEAIAFEGDRFYLTAEVEREGHMAAYVLGGRVAPNREALYLDEIIHEVPAQTRIDNLSEEALVVTPRGLLSLHEVHGAAVNASPAAHLYPGSAEAPLALAFPRIEYRVTDASALDEHGRFWVINYFWPGDSLLYVDQDPLAPNEGREDPLPRSRPVERLIELVLTADGIELAGSLPLDLPLDARGRPRNWEGIARLQDRGFLLVTDRFPETMLAFIPYPGASARR